jgi:hypothetical protein
MKGTVLERLWARLVPDHQTGCLIWTGAQNGVGYGRMWADGYQLTHRVAYELMVGPIPPGLVIDHLCRVSLCANPAHLEAVTPAVNTQRGNVPAVMAARGAARTHCRSGHEYNAANTYIRPNAPGRDCRICIRERSARYKIRQLGREAS